MVFVKEKIAYHSVLDLEYEMTSSELIDEYEYISYTTYGIRLLSPDNEILLEIIDISTDKSFVENFLYLCEIRLVSLIHVMEILEDYIP